MNALAIPKKRCNSRFGLRKTFIKNCNNIYDSNKKMHYIFTVL